MPELSRFYGIIIRMYNEAISQHNRPHFHAYYQGSNISVSIDGEVEVIAGQLPRKQERLVLAWAEMHLNELRDNWELSQSGAKVFSIEPLK
ncbi:MAG: DUF4160 domain-containing protein [Psychroflexus sp.]